ncbi:type IX secretion system membrane protein PorP/SprF, partial [Spirosoma lituiforme]
VGTSLRRHQFSSWTSYTTDAVVGLLEVQLTDQLRFGYAYDRTLSQLQSVAPSSHEVMIRYEFGFGKNRILTPRYF